MNSQKNSFGAHSGTAGTPEFAGGWSSGPGNVRFPPGEPLLQKKYRDLARTHLDGILDRLFADFTGLHFHIAWSRASPNGPAPRALPSGWSVCCQPSGSPLLPDCRTCGPQRLAATLASEHGHRFTCRLGVRNFWYPIRVRHETLGIAYLQALEHQESRGPGLNRRRRAARKRLRRAGTVVLSRLKFSRAARFLRHIVQYVQTASLNDLRKNDLTTAGRAVVALEREQARLHETLRRYLPALPQAPRSPGPETRGEQVVHDLLQRVEWDYPKPLTLQRLAGELGMNAAYLSALFSHVAGIPFKTYLTELRLEKARELLGNSSKTTSEVAFAVGYASEDRFRLAFKQATGLSPKVWRETMQPRPSAPES